MRSATYIIGLSGGLGVAILKQGKNGIQGSDHAFIKDGPVIFHLKPDSRAFFPIKRLFQPQEA